MTEVKLVPFEASHTYGMVSADMQLLHDLALSSESYTILINNKPVACGGVADLYDNKTLWAIFSDGAQKHMLPIMRKAKGIMGAKSGKHIALIGTDAGGKMASMIGMKPSDTVINGAVLYEVVTWN